MQRPKLEVASWIAGVIGAIVAVVALAYQLRQPAQSGSDLPPAVQPVSQASAPFSSVAAASSEPLSDYRKRLRSGLEAAKRLNDYRERDEAILNIAKSAIRDDYYMFAFEASRSINSHVTRDAVADAVSCHLGHRGEYEDGRAVALAIGNYRDRDASLRRISYLATVRPGEGEDGYSCDVSPRGNR